MPNIINELKSWLELADTPSAYKGWAGASPEVLPSELGLGFAYKANLIGNPTIQFRVANATEDAHAVAWQQLTGIMGGITYHGVWTPNPTSFPDETLIPPLPVGWYWLCDAAGVDKGGRQWSEGDFAIYNGKDATLNAGWDQISMGIVTAPPIPVGAEGMALVVNAGGNAEWGAPIENANQVINGGQF